MKLTFTGKAEPFTSSQQQKLKARLDKLGKTIDARGEREARAIVTQERHLNHVELTVNAYDHAFAVKGSDRDVFAAVNDALDKLEKQLQRMNAKWRTTNRHKVAPKRTPEHAAAAGIAMSSGAPRNNGKKKPNARRTVTFSQTVEVFPVNDHGGGKPMTLEEAMLEIGASDNYFSYIDAATQRVAVLLRRKDGHFDLVEG